MSGGMRWTDAQLREYEKGKKLALEPVKEKRKSKYGNVVAGGYDSSKEARRAQELELLQKAGEINNLRHHTVFDLVVNGVIIGKYESDFDYYNPHAYVVEDVKGVRTDVYKLKKKLLKAIHGIEIVET
jgi:hypothetical protein